jgi:hypothetical protein
LAFSGLPEGPIGPNAPMRILRSILLSPVAAGMVGAARADPDGALAHAEMLFGAGAFALAWLAYAERPTVRTPRTSSPSA